MIFVFFVMFIYVYGFLNNLIVLVEILSKMRSNNIIEDCLYVILIKVLLRIINLSLKKIFWGYEKKLLCWCDYFLKFFNIYIFNVV